MPSIRARDKLDMMSHRAASSRAGTRRAVMWASLMRVDYNITVEAKMIRV